MQVTGPYFSEGEPENLRMKAIFLKKKRTTINNIIKKNVSPQKNKFTFQVSIMHIYNFNFLIVMTLIQILDHLRQIWPAKDFLKYFYIILLIEE